MASPKQPVQEPGGCRGVTVEPGAVQPEAQARLVLHADVIARRFAVLAPPGAFDAFWPFGRGYFMQRAPPAETQRRPVRHARQGLDWLWAREQPQRPRAQIHRFAKTLE